MYSYIVQYNTFTSNKVILLFIFLAEVLYVDEHVQASKSRYSYIILLRRTCLNTYLLVQSIHYQYSSTSTYCILFSCSILVLLII